MAIVQEQRKAGRIEFRGRVEIATTTSHARTVEMDAAEPHLEASPVNFSEGGICLRLQRALDIRSRVMVRLFPEHHKRLVECTGRVAWVVQRLDLRDAPPFLYDVGVEFINPSARMRQFTVGTRPASKILGDRPRRRTLLPVTLHERCYIPRLEQESIPGNRWHLVVVVDGAPCFSQHYASEHEAIADWERFKRQRA